MTVSGKGSTQNVLAPNYVTVRKEEKRASEICCPTQRNAKKCYSHSRVNDF